MLATFKCRFYKKNQTKPSCLTVKKWAYTQNVCYLNLVNS